MNYLKLKYKIIYKMNDIEKMNVKQLKELCKINNLKMNSKRLDLIIRLQNYFNGDNSNLKIKQSRAGGSETNRNGLEFEHKNVKINNIPLLKNNFIYLHKRQFQNYMNDKRNNKLLGHGCKQPDKAFVNEECKTIFIIEEKTQSTSGSVCEKIQTAVFKKNNYNNVYENYNIHYIYILDKWYKTNIPAELQYLTDNSIPYYFSDDNYVKELETYIKNKIGL